MIVNTNVRAMLFCPGVPRVMPVSALHGFMNSGPYQSARR